MAEAKELDLAIKVSIIELGATVKKIVDHYHAAGVREENQRAIAELQRIMEFLAQALVDVRVRERQFLSASGQALDFVATVIDEQSSFLEDSLHSRKFLRLWNAQESASKLKDVQAKLHEAFITGLNTATIQIALEKEAMRRADHGELRGKLEEVAAGQQAVAASQSAVGAAQQVVAASQAQVLQDVQCQQAAGQQQLNVVAAATKDLATNYLPGDSEAPQEAARALLNHKADGSLIAALEEFDRVEREWAQARQRILKSPYDRVTGGLMIDPVWCSDTWIYCRFSAFDIIDSGCTVPGARNGKFEILDDNLDMRQQLFDAEPAAEGAWRQKRSEYIGGIAALEAAGQHATARLHAQRALQFLPPGDPQVPSLQRIAAPVPAADAGPLTAAADSDAVAATAALMPVEDDPLISFQTLPTTIAQDASMDRSVLEPRPTEISSAPAHVYSDQANEELRHASLLGDASAVQATLESGADVDAQAEFEEPALHQAARKGHGQVVRQLIAAGADLDARNMDDDTALHVAAVEGHAAVVRQLLTAGSRIGARNKAENTVLHKAAAGGCVSIIQHLVDQGADVEARERFGRTPLHLAADGNRVEAVQALLGCGADVNAEDLRRDMALHYGAADNSADLVQLLVRSGARINGRGGAFRTALHLAARRGHIEAARALLVGGASVFFLDENRYTPLHSAAEEGHAPMIQLLLSFDGHRYIDRTTKDGMTALHIAAKGGYGDAAAALLSAGCDADAKVRTGVRKLTAAGVAKSQGHSQLAEYLVPPVAAS